MTREEFVAQFFLQLPSNKEKDFPLKKAGRPAAVLIPIVDYGSSLSILLTQRALHLKHHPGQVSFPGGGLDENETAIAGALRETHEEVGIPTDHIEPIGALPLYRTISGYSVRPVVGFLKPQYPVAIDKNEVEDIFEVPVSFLLDQRHHKIHYVERKGFKQPVYFIPWQDKLIWGATAAILRNLSHVIRTS